MPMSWMRPAGTHSKKAMPASSGTGPLRLTNMKRPRKTANSDRGDGAQQRLQEEEPGERVRS